MALCRGRDRPCRAQPPDGHAASRSRRPRHHLPWFDAWDTLAATRRDRWLELTGRQIAFRDAVPRRWCVTVSVARDAPILRDNYYMRIVAGLRDSQLIS